jgi:hypothetical protein
MNTSGVETVRETGRRTCRSTQIHFARLRCGSKRFQRVGTVTRECESGRVTVWVSRKVIVAYSPHGSEEIRNP